MKYISASILSLTLLLWLSPRGTAAEPATLTIHANQQGPRVSPGLYGIFFEEINCAGDGGIYAELVRNRSFEDAAEPQHWKTFGNGSATCLISLEPATSSGEFNKRVLKMVVSGSDPKGAGVVNEGYWGVSVKKGETYRFSMNARGDGAKAGALAVSLESQAGKLLARKTFGAPGAEWRTLKTSLRSSETDPQARLVITSFEPATVWLDLVSLFPKDTWKGRENGLRADLAGMLQGIKPAFVRFPGGCWVEGDTMDLAYRWKQTIGDLGARRTQYNIWQYQSTHGLGYHEYLQMCEDLGAEPLFVVNCGMSHKQNVPMEQLGPFVQDALDAIEYANGPATSTWGAVRAQNGHPKPFGLRFLEIGNENGGKAYAERYAAFVKAIKARYPDMRLIANDWGGIPKDSPIEIVDEHYYNSPAFFIQNADKYDAYDRKGPKIYVGEYAVTQGCGQGNLAGALGEAAFMTGMERNSDVVVMSSYAPLFANIHYKKWNPDLINFDSSRVYGIPSYYVQQMFAQNRADVILKSELKAAIPPIEPPRGGIGLGTWNTQAEYKDIEVVRDGQVLFAEKAPSSIDGWKVYRGDWKAEDGVLRQAGNGEDRRITAGDPAWKDYTLRLKARKLGGVEGFLIMFNVRDDLNWTWWNIGGWGNTRHAIEHSSGGGKATLGGDMAGRVETGKWYDIRIELKGADVSCYLDGKLMNKARIVREQKPVHAVAGLSEKSDEIVVKLVNVTDHVYSTRVAIQGVEKLASTAQCAVLTSASAADENSISQPVKVAPVTTKIKVPGPNFEQVLPANSLTVLRLKKVR